jgi:Type II secretion system (T2SS), protein J
MIMTYQPSGTASPGPSPTPTQAANTNNTTAAAAFETSSELSQSFTFWQAATDKSGLRPSHFKGKSDQMTFISASNFRIYRDAPESEFTKVTYQVVRDDEPAINGFKVDGSNILRRGVNADVFDNDDYKDREQTHNYTMLRGVVKAEFGYYRWQDNKLEHYNTWDSDTDDFRNQIPDIIEIVLDMKGPQQMSFQGNYRFKPEIPIHGFFPSF